MADYYKEQGGFSRYTLILPTQYKDKLHALSKEFKITQGEVLETMLDNVGADIKDKFVLRRVAKLETRKKNKPVKVSPKKELMEKLKGMSEDQIAKLLQSV